MIGSARRFRLHRYRCVAGAAATWGRRGPKIGPRPRQEVGSRGAGRSERRAASRSSTLPTQLTETVSTAQESGRATKG